MTNKKRDQYLKSKYGIGLKEYKRMFRAQKGVCAICRRKPKPGKNLHVDHDHATGEVRGLLDYYCNRRLVGRNNEQKVRLLVEYLMPGYDLIRNNLDMHKLEMDTRHVVCDCLACVRRDVNFENKLFKPKSC